MQCRGSVTFGMDLDPRIQITDLWIRIRILLFRQLADKMPTKNKFFSKFFCTSVFKEKKSKRSNKIVKSRFFLLFLHVDGFYGMVC
jgi:hypothetical protein